MFGECWLGLISIMVGISINTHQTHQIMPWKAHLFIQVSMHGTGSTQPSWQVGWFPRRNSAAVGVKPWERHKPTMTGG
jgi:hypothetical protein